MIFNRHSSLNTLIVSSIRLAPNAPPVDFVTDALTEVYTVASIPVSDQIPVGRLYTKEKNLGNLLDITVPNNYSNNTYEVKLYISDNSNNITTALKTWRALQQERAEIDIELSKTYITTVFRINKARIIAIDNYATTPFPVFSTGLVFESLEMLNWDYASSSL